MKKSLLTADRFSVLSVHCCFRAHLSCDLCHQSVTLAMKVKVAIAQELDETLIICHKQML